MWAAFAPSDDTPVKRPNGSILLLAHARFAAVVRNGFHEGGELQTPK